ncbi:MAG: hypothetical protein KF841_13240 [Phycisphaerae bacterium]|nr:hypothetical protein [Phycisphaerae bacterium]
MSILDAQLRAIIQRLLTALEVGELNDLCSGNECSRSPTQSRQGVDLPRRVNSFDVPDRRRHIPWTWSQRGGHA